MGIGETPIYVVFQKSCAIRNVRLPDLVIGCNSAPISAGPGGGGTLSTSRSADYIINRIVKIYDILVRGGGIGADNPNAANIRSEGVRRMEKGGVELT